MAGCTGLEPVASGVTVGSTGLARGRRVSQRLAKTRNTPLPSSGASLGFAAFSTNLGIPVVSAGAGANGPERMLTVREVAKLLNVGTSTVYKLCAEGKLPHVRVLSAIRFRLRELKNLAGSSYAP